MTGEPWPWSIRRVLLCAHGRDGAAFAAGLAALLGGGYEVACGRAGAPGADALVLVTASRAEVVERPAVPAAARRLWCAPSPAEVAAAVRGLWEGGE